MNGFLLVDKPRGLTSFDVVALCRKVFKTKKVGHSGTLDPFATGLLIIAVGEATKLLEYLPTAPKIYSGRGVLGNVSDTLDRDGVISRRVEEFQVREMVTPELIKKCVQDNLTGRISQIPPAFSAIKIGGVPAYKRARNGEIPEMKPREVEVFLFEVFDIELPYFSFRCSVTGGTYIRSLIAELGELMKVGAYTDVLRREAIAEFDVARAVSVDDLQHFLADSSKDPATLFLPLEAGASELQPFPLTQEQFTRLSHGLLIESEMSFPDPVCAAFLDSRLVGILEVIDGNQLKFRKLIHRHDEDRLPPQAS